MKSVFLFRHDLRTEDHPALNWALENSQSMAFAIQRPSDFDFWGIWRQKFWLESTSQLKASLLEYGHELFLVPSKEQFEDFVCVFLTQEYAYDEVLEQKRFHKCTVREAQELYENLNGENLPTQFTPFRKFLEKNETPLAIFPLPDFTCVQTCNSLSSRSLIWPQIPQKELHPKTSFPFSGGELAGKKRLNEYFFERRNVLSYKKTRNQMYGTEGSTKFSAWLALGALSPRQVYAELKHFESLEQANESTYWVFFELLWREFFRCMGRRYGKKFFSLSGIKKEPPNFQHDDKKIESWKRGETGEPIVNACLRELVQTGFISNRGRQIAASFFVNELNQDWRVGAFFFEQHLIDYDVYSNWGNWMYLAGVGFDPRGKRWFNPKKQAQSYDGDGTYREMWRF